MAETRLTGRSHIGTVLLGMGVTPRDEDGTLAQATEATYWTRGRPRVRLVFALADGRVECVRVEIGARFDSPNEPDPRPVTTTHLRAIKLGRLIARAKKE